MFFDYFLFDYLFEKATLLIKFELPQFESKKRSAANTAKKMNNENA